MHITWLLYPIAAVALPIVVLAAWRQFDHAADNSAWRSLIALQDRQTAVFDLSMLDGLPELAQRYFRYTIEPGTPLCTVMEIEMTGQLGLGSKDAPKYQPMRAHQILSPPHGLVWKLKSGAISGSDGALPNRSWTRFWLFGVIPVVRASGPDHRRSAFGRVVAEAAMWAPASLLPGDHVHWDNTEGDIARAIVSYGDFTQTVEISLDAKGEPQKVSIQRWSNENPQKTFRLQPFGGELSDFRSYEGYRLPAHVEGGNYFGTPDYFPFFKADVTKITCPRPE
ncbi:MAG: hypothetical protein HKN18_06440 [Silicimonas sp.]|nr:hypothetical protein [Silicimonas sp.]